MKQSLVLAGFGAFCLALTVHAVEPADQQRLDEVASRGVHVMPFDLEKTLHIFNKTENGGLQQVIAKNNDDRKQIELIRSHLAKISSEFKQGDFTNPAKIHGEDMPGLATLKNAGPGQIQIQYREIDNGAEIEYTSEQPELIDAVHSWFDAQLSDHARHAVSGHHQHHMQQLEQNNQ